MSKYFGFFLLVAAMSARAQLSLSVTTSSGNFSLTCKNPTIVLTANSSYTGGAVNFTWTNPQQSVTAGSTITVTGPGIYSLAASSGSLAESKTVSVNINTISPNLTLTANTSSLSCNAPTVILKAISSPTNVTYKWTYPGYGFGCSSSLCVVATSAIYGATVTNIENGCQTTRTISIEEGRSYPVVTLPALYTVECAGTATFQPIVTSGTVNLTYQWEVPPGASTSFTSAGILIASTPGEYTLTVTNTINECISKARTLLFDCVGLTEFANGQERINIFPVPANERLNIVAYRATSVNFSILNIFGCVLQVGSCITNCETDISFLPNGLYVLKIETEKAITVKYISVLK